MRTLSLETWRQNRDFTIDTTPAERRVNFVFLLTFLTMTVEIIAGLWSGSMALLADGWHMLTHCAAFAITLFSYRYARRHRNNPDFTFGTGKVTSLGGFASAVALAVVALMMAIESIERLFSPQSIRFGEAIMVATIGLVVNLISAVLLHHEHGHEHGHGHENHHHAHDHNLKAAYFHVLADTLTSVLAIIALFAGKYLNWIWMDALMGILGAVIILKWSYGLLKQSSDILLDKSDESCLATKIKEHLESTHQSRIVDICLWKTSPSHSAVIISLVTQDTYGPLYYRDLISNAFGINHITVEIHRLDSYFYAHQ